MKKFVSMFLALAMCLSLSALAFATEVPIKDIRRNDGTYVSGAFEENVDFKNEVFGQTVTTYNEEVNQAEVAVSTDKKSMNVVLTYHGVLYYAVLSGEYAEVALQNMMGYVGVYEGLLTPTEDETVQPIPVIADVTFTDAEIFAILTLGYVDDPDNFDILYFGMRSQQIKEISRIYATDIIEKQTIGLQDAVSAYNNFVEPASARLDATIKFQGKASGSMNGYEVSKLSVFHSSELVNQNDSMIYVKLNSNCDAVKKYLINSTGPATEANFVLTYPDTICASISSSKVNELTVDGENYTPKSGAKNVTIEIPYLTPTQEISFIDLTFNMSKTDVSLSKLKSTNQGYNKIAWEIWQYAGWQGGVMDGDYRTETGYTVSSDYQYNGNDLNLPITAPIVVTGSLRYEYLLMVGTDFVYYHIQAPTMTINTSIKILPHNS